MKAKNELYQLIYDHYAAKILFGCYAYGDSLPQVTQISAYFRMAAPTVRAALELLQRDGYIALEASKAAKVIYKASLSQYVENIANYFVPREDGLRDIGQAGLLLIEPLWKAGLERWTKDDWSYLSHEMKNLSTEALSPPTEFYIIVLSSLNNKLVLNLYWEMVRYLRIMYLTKNLKARNLSFKELEVPTNEDIIRQIHQEYVSIYAQAVGEVFDFIKIARTKYAFEQVKQIPFEWNIYRHRPQMRYSIAADIIRKITTGDYPIGSYLPSLPQMAEQYDVAMSTVRRTLSILTHFGVIKSHQGKGTQVCLNPKKLNLSKPEIQEALIICIEGLQLLALTIREVSLFVLKSAPDKAIDDMADKFSQIHAYGKSYLFFEVYLAFITEQCSSVMVRQCYHKLRELLACGYPLVLLYSNKLSIFHDASEVILQAEADLRAHDFEKIANKWSDFLKEQYKKFISFADMLGLKLHKES